MKQRLKALFFFTRRCRPRKQHGDVKKDNSICAGCVRVELKPVNVAASFRAFGLPPPIFRETTHLAHMDPHSTRPQCHVPLQMVVCGSRHIFLSLPPRHGHLEFLQTQTLSNHALQNRPRVPLIRSPPSFEQPHQFQGFPQYV